MKTLVFFTFIISILLLCPFISPHYVYSVQESLTISTDKTSYNYGDSYTISGQVNPVVPNQRISVEILHPSYPHPELVSLEPNADGNYLQTLPLRLKAIPSGNFSIIASYAGARNQTTFSYVGPGCNTQIFSSEPIIRGMPANNPRIVDPSGNAIVDAVKVGQQIQITADLANGQDCVMPFAYIVQIQDSNGVTQSLSWITGTLDINQSLTPGQSWIPTAPGTYTAQIFTWDSLDNPNSLALPMSATISVQ
ncbi:MAG: hypothetical protein KGH99_04820 [Thaumarchaeota archaeon]|nr:hypothetical protein [Candidatus Nitrosotalea sp.]MDE1872786.1 hypothetical protein [Nitrososphaerota archaeon]